MVAFVRLDSVKEPAIAQTIYVERRWRGSGTLSSVPTLGHLPPQLKILHIAEDRPPFQIEPGIWSRSWNVNVSIAPSSDLQPNPVRRLVSITFPPTPNNDPISEDMPVLIRLVSGIEAPNFMHLGTVRVGGKQTRRFLLRAADDVVFSVLNMHSTSSAFSISKPSPIPNRSCWLELSFQPKEPENHCANLVIETSHPKSPQVAISVRGIGSNTEKND